MKNRKGFTLIELLAVIVILGLLMAIAIPSVTKYITESRKKTLTTTVGNYIGALVNDVNDLSYTFTGQNTIYAVPIECIGLERGGTNPFGHWYQANDAYFAYVLIQYDDVNSKYVYGFTFKDSAGYGLYPTIQANINERGTQVKTGYTINKPKTGDLTSLVTLPKWQESGFKVDSNTNLQVLEATSENEIGNGISTCTLQQRGDNYAQIEEEKEEKEKTKKVPAGAVYTTVGGETISPGEYIPEPSTGDVFIYGDYIYKYNTYTSYFYDNDYTAEIGWNVYGVRDYYKTKYGEILDHIGGVPVTAMDYTFSDAQKIVEAPEIPKTIKRMKSTFYRRSSLLYPPVIPEGVEIMDSTFSECTKLKVASNIPESVTIVRRAFYQCTSLNSIVTFPTKNRLDIEGVFSGCKSLITAPILPDNVYVGSDSVFSDGIFGGCTSLKTYVGSVDADYDFSNFHIPDSIVNMTHMFYATPITHAPKPSKNATIFSGTYAACKNLKEYNHEFPTSGKLNLMSMFYGCTSLEKFGTFIPNNGDNLNDIFSGCTSLTGTVDIRTGASNHSISCGSAFYNTVKPITIVGCSGQMKYALVSTANNGNVS